MKYLKTYESLKDVEIGDYVAVNSSTSSSAKDIRYIYKFINSHVGQVVDITNLKANDPIEYGSLLIVTYDYREIPEKIIGYFRNWFDKKDLKYFYTRHVLPKDVIFKSKNKKDVEIFLKSKEYNI